MTTGTVLMHPTGGAVVPLDDPDALYEIIDGVRVELPPMSTYANLIATRIYDHMRAVAIAEQSGAARIEDMFILPINGLRGRRPDVAFVSAERWSLDRPLPLEGDWEVVPDLCTEVVSPNDRVEDLFEKIDEYFAAGVRRVWVVTPAQRRVYVYDSPTRIATFSIGDVLEGDNVVPGFSLPLAELFERGLPSVRAPESNPASD